MASRTDETTGAAFAGSQLQTQLWVNRRAEQLDTELRATIPGLDNASLDWRSPLESDSFNEYKDGAFLKAVDLTEHAASLKEFWPARGPVWDALSVVELNGTTGVLLGEGKSYPGELYGSGTKAGPASRLRIEKALKLTQNWLGIDQPMDDWCGPLYQTANRLAHLYWLNEVVGIRAWFVHLLYLDDAHSNFATSQQTWQTELAKADKTLGLPEHVPGAGHVFLQAGTYDELVGAPKP
jgi:hypothetical protein